MSKAMKPNETREQYLKRVAAWCSKFYNDRRLIEYCHVSHTALRTLKEAEKLFTDLQSFGVEGFFECGGVEYLNMGDTYDVTVCFTCRDERFRVISYGDIVEKWGDRDDD